MNIQKNRHRQQRELTDFGLGPKSVKTPRKLPKVALG
jgi:hypothetical protein